MSILPHTWMVGLAMVFVLSFAMQAQAGVVVAKSSELETDKRVQAAGEEYKVLSAANVIFAQCATEYPEIATDQTYLTQRFAALSAEFPQAYFDAYVARVGAPPEQAMVTKYVNRIRALQQSTVNDMALSIRDHGCGHYAVRTVVKYVHKAYRQTLAVPAQSPEE